MAMMMMMMMTMVMMMTTMMLMLTTTIVMITNLFAQCLMCYKENLWFNFSQLQWPFADADDFHSEANKKKMAEGCPLNDQVTT